jgi:hypothetical protein
MKPTRIAAATLALALSAGAAQAQTTIVTEPAPPAAVVTAPPAATVVTSEPLVLSPVQRQVIYRTIVREPAVQQQVTVGASAPVVEYRVGTRIPASTTLYPIPQQVVTEVPAVRSYRYMVINDRAWLVDPATSEIVAEVGE